MSSIRIAFLFCAVAALLVAAGCGDDDDSEGTTTASAENCTPEELRDRRATARSRSPPTAPPSRPTSSTTTRPTARASRAPSPTRSPTSSATTRPTSSGSWSRSTPPTRPGPKDFDFDVNQISITPKRAEQVDFSSPYYEAEQAVVALKDSEAAERDLARRPRRRRRSASRSARRASTRSTTSIQPSERAAGLRHLERRRHRAQARPGRRGRRRRADGLLPDRHPGAGGETVGQFPAPGGDQWGALLEKDSPLTACVSQAIDELSSSGELAEIEQQWMSEVTKAPVLE